MPGPETRDLGIHTGDVLAGKYRVTRILGSGAMGVVVAAHHEQLDTKVAMKLLLPELVGNATALARFSREAKAVAKLTNEHVARVLDVGTLESGLPYIVMEYLEGEDLASRVARDGPLPIEQAVEFVVHACVAVAEAHGFGIIHRDLKPANLFCVRRPDDLLSVKVLDFGISRVIATGEAPEQFAVTKNLEVIGSPLYMSPEQMKSSRHADAQSDVWALGVILYELLSGQVPFMGESETDIAIQVASQPPRSLVGFRPDVPPALEAVVLKCLEKDKARRYVNVADLATDLVPFAPPRALGAIERIAGTVERAKLAADDIEFDFDVDLKPVTVRPPAPAGDRHAATVVRAPDSPRAAGVSAPIGKAVLLGALAVLLVVGGGGLFFARGGARTTASSRTPAATQEPSTAAPAASNAAPAASAVAAAASTTLPAETPPQASADAPATTAAPSASPLSPPAPRATSRHRSSPRSSPNCDVPYTLDGEGRKHFRPECFLKK